MRRSLLALAIAALVAASVPADAAPSGALHIKDLAGDANGVNTQFGLLPLPSVSTAPASVGGADILGIDFTTIYKKVGKKTVLRGTKVAMRLAAPVMIGVNYLVTADVPSTCDGGGGGKVMQLGYQDLKSTQLIVATCQAPTTTGTGTLLGTADVSGSTITWTVDAYLKPGQIMRNVYASSNVFVLGIIDEVSSTGTYTYR